MKRRKTIVITSILNCTIKGVKCQSNSGSNCCHISNPNKNSREKDSGSILSLEVTGQVKACESKLILGKSLSCEEVLGRFVT